VKPFPLLSRGALSRSIIGPLVYAFGLALTVAASPAPDVDSSRDIAVIDYLIASAKSGEEMVKIGDMGFKASVLKAWRDHLAAQTQKATQRRGEVQPEGAFAGGVQTWTSNTIPYTFDAAVTPAHQQAFLDAAGEWATFANLHFLARTSQANYLLVKNAPDGLGEGGFSSGVGMIGGQQYIQIGPNSWNRDTLCHEIGHVLGLVHEHQRSDRDNFVTIQWNNVAFHTTDMRYDGNFVLLPSSQNKGAYDFLSVMHYAKNLQSVDPATLNTVVPNTSPINYSQYLDLMGTQYDRVLSVGDRTGMAIVYGANPIANSSVVTNTKDSGIGSLRAAIYYGIDNPNTTITFNIPTSDTGFGGGVFTITPSDYMTRVGGGTIIDGSTQTGGTGNPTIVLDGGEGKLVGTYEQGLRINEANCTIKGLQITNFSGSGVVLYGGGHGNIIGGTTAVARNVISGSSERGVLITDAGTNGNIVEGNYIGVARDGMTANANGFSGLEIADGAQGNTVGGTASGAGNVISGNTLDGVRITGANTNNNVVRGNVIGLKAGGGSAAPNAGAGIDIFTGPQSTIIGGTISGAGNVVSGNTLSGVIINACNSTLVQGNYIGTNPAGTVAMPNSQAGVYIFGGAQNTIVGGTTASARNIISGNTNDGIDLNGVSNTTIQGNYIGVDVTGATAIANTAGVALFSGSTSNTIGGLSPGARNIISGNSGDGFSVNGVSNTTIQANYIGVDVSGSIAKPNGGAGVALFGGATSTTIGGTVPAARNVISGNTGAGVSMGSATTSTTIQGNYIGLDTAGIVKTGNATGIDLFGGANNNTIGGTSAGARNFISGNSGYGIDLGGSGTNTNAIQGNTIGFNIAGGATGNGTQGVAIFGGAQSNTIGGSTIGASNIIANSTNEGVAISGNMTIKNKVSQNSIFGNHFSGITIFSGGNSGQPAPTLSTAALSPTLANFASTNVSGNFTGSASTIEFFASPPGNDEGQFFVGSLAVSGAGNFSALLPAAIPGSPPANAYVVTATATDSNGNTSQFSSPVTVSTADTDNDGIPDNWMQHYFGHTTGLASDKSRAGDDVDGTGMTNLQKFVAGLDPMNPNSVFRISAFARAGNSYQISFPSVAGKTYRLEYRDDLIAGNWAPLVDGIFSASGGTLQIVDPSAAGLNKRFYRAIVVP
jgi:hypothetical protein